MKQYPSIKIEKYLNIQEIKKNLDNVQYIIMAAPTTQETQTSPLHLSIFLNTQEHLPEDIKQQILEKFCTDYDITNPQEVLSQLMPVGFALTSHETAMPMLLVKPQDRMSIPNISMHVIDFLADSTSFQEVKKDRLTGWSYVYE
jgi:hypothetical protein